MVAVASACASWIPRYFLVALYWGVPPPRDGSSARLVAPGATPPPADSSVGLMN